MTETIRERIIEAVVTKLWEVTTSKGYKTEAGGNVRLADHRISPDDCPAIIVWPGEEDVSQEYGLNVCDMQLRVEAMSLFEGSNPGIISERLLGDLIEAITAIKWTLPFTSGGTYEPQVGDTIIGKNSNATGYIESVTVTSGSWAGGDAVGTITFRRGVGSFSPSEPLSIDVHEDVATVVEAPTGENPVATTTGGLADRIMYVQGGPISYPESREIVTGSSAIFLIRYKTLIGNPYALG